MENQRKRLIYSPASWIIFINETMGREVTGLPSDLLPQTRAYCRRPRSRRGGPGALRSLLRSEIKGGGNRPESSRVRLLTEATAKQPWGSMDLLSEITRWHGQHGHPRHYLPFLWV